ncbi:MAG: alpha-amylase family glycosyl hydrolase [Promethearchaeota archaeon]
MFDSPRIYNLFPKLVGKIPEWLAHIEAIKRMNFNWIYINPINELGFSGSLYSIKDYFRLDPQFAVDKLDQVSWSSFKTFIKSCHEKGIKVMLDIVINHTAVDMVEWYPNWYAKKWAIIDKEKDLPVKFFENHELNYGEPEKNPPKIDEIKYPPEKYSLSHRIANPYAIDPANAEKITIWGDLAEIDYNSPYLDEIMTFWKKLLRFYAEIGVDGYRCDAAYQISSSIWKPLIDHVKSINPDALFLAETLGARPSHYEDIQKAGFDFITTSLKYWDYTSPWCVEQYEMFRKYAASVSFPESHDTPRLAQETGGRIDIQKFKYFFSSFFSAGVSMPIGYEFGFHKQINVVKTIPMDWEVPTFDISDFITQCNFFKQMYVSLNEDGAITHFDYGNKALLVMRKESITQNQAILLCYNKDWNNNQELYLESMPYFLDYGTKIFRINLEGAKMIYPDESLRFTLKPNEFILFLQNK